MCVVVTSGGCVVDNSSPASEKLSSAARTRGSFSRKLPNLQAPHAGNAPEDHLGDLDAEVIVRGRIISTSTAGRDRVPENEPKKPPSAATSPGAAGRGTASTLWRPRAFPRWMPSLLCCAAAGGRPDPPEPVNFRAELPARRRQSSCTSPGASPETPPGLVSGRPPSAGTRKGGAASRTVTPPLLCAFLGVSEQQGIICLVGVDDGPAGFPLLVPADNGGTALRAAQPRRIGVNYDQPHLPRGELKFDIVPRKNRTEDQRSSLCLHMGVVAHSMYFLSHPPQKFLTPSLTAPRSSLATSLCFFGFRTGFLNAARTASIESSRFHNAATILDRVVAFPRILAPQTRTSGLGQYA